MLENKFALGFKAEAARLAKSAFFPRHYSNPIESS